MMHIAFAFGAHLYLGKGSAIGPVFIALGGTGLISFAVFHYNQVAQIFSKRSDLIGIMHNINSFVAGFCLAFSPIVISFD